MSDPQTERASVGPPQAASPHNPLRGLWSGIGNGFGLLLVILVSVCCSHFLLGRFEQSPNVFSQRLEAQIDPPQSAPGVNPTDKPHRAEQPPLFVHEPSGQFPPNARATEGPFPAPPLFPPQGSGVQATPTSPLNPPSAAMLAAPGVNTPEAPGLTFNFQEAPWSLVLNLFAQENGLSLQFEKIPAGTFTYFDRNRYSPKEALDLLNDYLLRQGFLVVQSGRNLFLLSQGDPIPDNLVQFVDAGRLESLGRNELASISLPVFGTAATMAAKELEGLLSPFGTVTPLSNAKKLVVTDLGGYLKRIHFLMQDHTGTGGGPTYVYQLKNAPAEEVAKSINDFLSNQTEAAPGTVPTRYLPQGSPNSLVVVSEKTTNSILARGTHEQLQQIQELILQLDHPPDQVLIQALLVEVELGNLDEFGVELGVQDSVLFERSVLDELITLTQTNTSPNGVQTSTQSVISQTSQPGFLFNGQPLGNNTAIHPSRIGSQGLSNFGVGRVNGDLQFGGLVLSAGSESVNVLLRALAANHHIDILSRPQIRTLHNKEALIQIGKQVPVVDGVSVTAVGSANPIIRQDQSGIILRVTPKVSPDGSVMIDVNAEKSAFQLTSGTGVPIFTDASNGNVIEAPVKDITTAQTSVSAKTGQTIVLGGMITNEVSSLDRRVPWLGDIPVLGHLFRYQQDQMRRKELLIFLTPKIIYRAEQSEQIKQEEAARIQLPYATAEQMHGSLFDAPNGMGGTNPATYGSEPRFAPIQWPQGEFPNPVPHTPEPYYSPGPSSVAPAMPPAGPSWPNQPAPYPVVPAPPAHGRYAPNPYAPAPVQQMSNHSESQGQAQPAPKTRSWLPWSQSSKPTGR